MSACMRWKKENGIIRSLEEMRPKTPVMLAAPFSRLGQIVVFADIFNSDQMKILEKVLKAELFPPYWTGKRLPGWLVFLSDETKYWK